MSVSTLLQKPKAVVFDATNAEHRKAYVNFINNGKWEVKFDLEIPFTSLPAMIMFKLAMLACSAEGAVDMSMVIAQAATIPTEKAVAVNDREVEKVA
jgi:hypothetical protein